MRRVVLLVIAALTLGACGQMSSANALHQWSTQSDFSSAFSTLLGDARHAAAALHANAPRSQLHTVCAVLLVDTQAANASLPTPDAQTTSLLGRAYEDLGSGANLCYNATSERRRSEAVASLSEGVGELSEARARVRSF